MIARVLSGEQIEKIHQASLDILERVGVVVPHEQMLGCFADLGAKVDFDKQRVWIPADLVMRLVETCGKKFSIFGRDTRKEAAFGVAQRNYNSIAGEASWVEEVGGERRYATLEDVATASRFADALENINIVGAMSDPHDVPVEYRCVEVFASQLRNTTKPVTFWFHDRASAGFIVEMMIAIRGDEKNAARYPLCYPFLEPISPLRFPFNGIDLLYETARLDLPVPVGPMAQMGLSAPATLAGTMAQQNAEVLAGICITQLVKQGLPVCYGGICHAFDMSTTQLIFSGPEQAIFGVAMTQLGKRYGLPVYINVGLTDSKRPDAQAGLEAGITLALGAAAGADIFGHMGIEISDEKLGIDVISEAGPGGTFIDTEHTVRHFREELWFPELLDREYYQSWLDSGASTMETRCRKRKEEILDAHQPEPISPELDRALDQLVAAAKRDLRPKAATDR
jgi:trimethylamine--corrinoid protein Co-methyltransferase